jgi:plastocyanin
MSTVRTLALGTLAVALLVAACGGTQPGWTYAPAPSVTPAPSVAPSDGGSAAPSDGGESAAPSDGGESAAPSDGGTGATVQISAINIAFDQAAVEAPADAPFQIEFANNDPGIPHNVEIKDAGGTSLFQGEVFNGVETRTYDVPALAAGEYTFICTVHPNMTGTLTAG